MATASSSIVWTSASSSGTLTSNKPISDCLQTLVTAGVLTQTADTGQVSWASVTATTTGLNAYEIYKLNDSLNSTYPLYIKFLYTNPVTSNYMSQVAVQVGTGSDGAGNLTGANASKIFRGMNNTNAPADTVSTPIYASAGEGYLTLFGGVGSTVATSNSGGFALAIERLRNSSGTALGDGLSIIGTFWSTAASGTTVYKTGTSGVGTMTIGSYNPLMLTSGTTRASLANLLSTGTCVWPPTTNRAGTYFQNTAFDGTNYLAAAWQPYAGKLYPANMATLIVDDTFPNFSTLTMTMYGGTHTYLTLNQNVLAPTPTGVTSPGTAAAVSYQSLASHLAYRYE